MESAPCESIPGRQQPERPGLYNEKMIQQLREILAAFCRLNLHIRRGTVQEKTFASCSIRRMCAGCFYAETVFRLASIIFYLLWVALVNSAGAGFVPQAFQGGEFRFSPLGSLLPTPKSSAFGSREKLPLCCRFPHRNKPMRADCAARKRRLLAQNAWEATALGSAPYAS